MVAGTSSGSVIGASSTKKTPCGKVPERAARHLEAEARLPGAAGPGERQEPVVGQQCRDLADLSRPSEEGRQPGRQVVRHRVERPDRREVALEILDNQLPEPLGLIEILEPMDTEISELGALGERFPDEGARRVGEEHLAAVPDAGDAAGAVNVESDVPLGAEAGLAGVHAHPDPDLDVVRPRLAGERALRGNGGRDRSGRRWKGDEEGVPLGPHLDATLRLEGRPQQLLVSSEDRRPSLALRLEQPGRPLDVGEQERDGTGQQLGHSVLSVRCRWRPAQDPTPSARLRRCARPSAFLPNGRF